MIWGEVFANGLVTLAAAFGGAFFAFLLERKARQEEQVAADVAAGNRALFILTQIWNKLIQHRKEIIDPFRGKDDAWLNMPQSASIRDTSIVFDRKELSFLLDRKPSVYQALMLEADRFQQVTAMIDRRNELIDTRVSTKLSLNAQHTDAQLLQALGGYTIKHLKIYASEIQNLVDQDLASSKAAYQALERALNEIYPKRKILPFVFSDVPIPQLASPDQYQSGA